MIHVTPAPGFRILNPFSNNQPLPPDGEIVTNDPYWHARAREGAVVIKAVE